MQGPGMRTSLAGAGMVVGGLLVAVGTMLPWVDLLDPVLATIPIQADKTAILVSGIVTLCAGLLFMVQRPRFHLMSVVGGGSALISLILLIRILFDLQARFEKPIDLTAFLAWEYWFALLGAFVGLITSVRAYREKPPAPATAGEQSGPATQRAKGWLSKNYLVAPAVIYALLITQIPFLVTIWYSFQKWNLLRPENSRFNGIQNYLDLFKTNEFSGALTNTVVLTTAAVVLSLLLGLLFAELVNSRFPGRGIVRTLLITPFLVMPVVGALGWKNMMLNPVFGVVDWVITSLGGPRVDWFTNYPMESIIMIVVWRWAPFMMIIMLAGMQALSDEVREAGRVDGATPLQEFRFIVLPHLKPFMQLCVLFGVIYILAEFDSIAMTTQGGPGDKTMNLPYLIYRTVFYSYDVGKAAAMGVVLVVVTFIFATYLIRMLGRLMEGTEK
jgi:sorbitol/mannitol transport system permease protein